MQDKISFLFLGDVIGRPGRRGAKRHLPALKKKYNPSFVIANGENLAGGIGLTEKTATEFLAQADLLTSGNHIWDKKDALEYLDIETRVIRPENYPQPCPGRGAVVLKNENGVKAAFLNLQGRVFMEPVDCPFKAADEKIEILREETPVIIVDFHAEATSEKQALGWYLDGKVSAVLGTHTHVPTADERILPKGTGYITDVGMVGGYNSVIGIRCGQAVDRFLTSRPQKFEPSKDGFVLSAVYGEVDSLSGRTLHLERVSVVEENGSE
ncbi:MAG: TIGR00282 family metallophosphoesterase [Candidatus Aminicenantes bacterium]